MTANISDAREGDEGRFEEPVVSTGIVYACIEEGGRFVKIGWAATLENAYIRWSNIQIGNPRRIRMRLIGEGGLRDEAALHSRLRAHAVRGEWFRIEGEVEDLVAKASPLPSRAGAGGSGRPPRERSAAEQWLVGVLADGPRRAGEVFAAGVAAGHSQKTIRRAGDSLGILRDPPGGGRSCRWLLPADLDAADEEA
jgi:hypothetical protein